MSNRELIIPANVALIPDGNRRWAKANKMNLFNGYNYGIKKFVKFSLWLKGFGSKSLTIWALSTENIHSRTSRELNILYKLYVRAAYDKEILKMLDELLYPVVIAVEEIHLVCLGPSPVAIGNQCYVCRYYELSVRHYCT